MTRRIAFLLIMTILSLGLAGCDTAEDRAQKHFEKAMAFVEDGDIDRAVIEFRNVFKLDGGHRAARLAFAELEEKRGNIQGAYGHYLLMTEQDPEDVTALSALARLDAAINNWDEAERHARAAAALDPDNRVVRGVLAGLDYRAGLKAGDPQSVARAVAVSRELKQADPTLWLPRQVLIDNLIRNEDWEAALTEVDGALEHFPDNIALYQFRLGILEKLGREDDIAAELRRMTEKFPDAGLHAVLVSRYIANGRLEEAEAYLRDRVAADPGNVDTYLELFTFLQDQVGQAAVTEEVDRALAEDAEAGGSHRAVFRSVRAVLDFEAGRRDAAIAELQNILDGAEPSEETDRIRLSLARMLNATGNAVGARAAVEQVLEHDAGQVDALKLKATWLIDDDRPGDALIELRAALDQAPRDFEVLTLMAQAQERVGNRELMGEMLALASEMSGNAPEEALRYVRYLLQEEKLLSAEDVLVAALRLRNTNPQILGALGNVYIRMADWPRAQGVIKRLTDLGSEETLALANELTARTLAGQQRSGELETFLSGLADGEGGLQAAASIVRLRLAQGDVEGARTYLDELLADDPGNPALRYIRAGILVTDGQGEAAADIYQALLDEDPRREQVWTALYNLRRSRGEDDAAAAVLEAGLAAIPDSAALKWAKASRAEAEGDIAGAIAIYEDLHGADSSSAIIANNLASLIATYETDPDSLQRAYAIARRLRGTKVPAMQDTYGWIAFRLGNVDEALEYLEPAAAALSGDPAVQFHLGEVYAALGQRDKALAQYRKVVDLVKDSPVRPPFMARVNDAMVQLTPVEN
ncbi:MAG: tetratricopeptide repeat protein [Marinibacterium sp.]